MEYCVAKSEALKTLVSPSGLGARSWFSQIADASILELSPESETFSGLLIGLHSIPYEHL